MSARSMKIKKLSMNSKIMLLTFSILAFSFFAGGIILLSNLLKDQEKAIGQTAMLVARTISNLPDLQKLVQNEDIEYASSEMNKIVEEIRVINKAEYIVVMNMDRIKLSHPSSKEIGKPSQSTDIYPAFGEHYYTSKAEGEVGTMIRAFVPIINEDKEQIGVVVTGYILPSFWELIHQYKSEILLSMGLSLLVCLWGAHTLGRHIKRQLFGLEPHEIAQLYVERNETFNAMHDGIIAVDNHLNITIFNKKAAEILGVEKKPKAYIGQNIYDVLPDTRLPEIVESGQPVYTQELYINEHSILSNRIPIRVKGETVGAVAVFQDLTDFKQLAEELTGVKAFVQALRIQTHEYKNKLHTIAGLLQLGHSKQALDYLSEVQTQHDRVTKFLNERIANENISGLLLSKMTRGKELGIEIIIDEESKLTTFPPQLDHHDFVKLFGNLIENAFDALQGMDRGQKEILISIEDVDGILAIEISDNGAGMSKEVQQNIFKNGFSTKNNLHSGIGLFLIKEIVDKGGGTIEVVSEEGIGTTFMITFEM